MGEQIDITKRVWDKSGREVFGLTHTGHGGAAELMGAVKCQSRVLHSFWHEDGIGSADRQPSDNDLTHTPPANVASVEEPTAAVPCSNCAEKDALIAHLEKEVARVHGSYRVLSEMFNKVERRTGR